MPGESISQIAQQATVINGSTDFLEISQATGNPSAPYVTKKATAALVASAGGGNPGGTSGQIQYNNTGTFGGFTLSGDATLNTGTGVLTIGANAVSNAKFRQSAALSVVGNAGSSTANVADITGIANQALVVNSAGTALAFGAVNLASSAAVTGNLPVGNLNSGTSASSTTFWRGDGTWAMPAGAGTVTSVAQTFTGGLISVSGSPITGSGTLALTVAGTSGGIPYFSSASAWASSALLAANAIMVGGGSGTAPATTTTGTGVLTAIGNAVNASGGLATSAVATLSSLTSIGTIGTGVWQGTVVGPTYGGTGVNNGSSTITLGGNLATSGAFGTTLTATGTTSVTLPTSGTLAILGANTFTALQTITQGTANAGVMASTGYSLTGSNAAAMVSFAGTLNTTGNPDVLHFSITNTAAGATSKFLNLLAGGAGATSVFSVDLSGNVVQAGGITASYMGLPVTASASVGTIQQYVNGAYVPILHTFTPGGGTQVGLNVFLGNLCGNQSTITGTGIQGTQNVGIGFNVMPNLTNGYENVGIGNYVLWSLTTGIDNTFVGTESGEQLTTGSFNTGLGTSTLLTATTATGCTAIGTAAGGSRSGHAVWTASNASYFGTGADNWNNQASTSAATAAGSNVLTFTAIPLYAAVGMFVCDLPSLGKPCLFTIPQGTFITAKTATTLTLSQNVVNTAYQNGVALGDTIEVFGQVVPVATSAATASGTTLHFANVPNNIVAGMVVYDVTTPTAITYGATPTTVVSTTGTTVVISAAVTGAGVGSGDSIIFLNNQFNNMTVLGAGAFGLRDNTVFIGRDLDTVVIGQPESGANSAIAMLAINAGRTATLPTINMGQTTPIVSANGDIWFDTSGYMWVYTHGQKALLSAISSTGGLIIGSSLINSGITGVNNVLVGFSAAQYLTSGSRNACLGGGVAITSGGDNTLFGYNAGLQVNTGGDNTLIGSNVGYQLTSGYSNTCIGRNSGISIATTSYNTFIGDSAGNNVTGSANVIIGSSCGSQITSGNYNTILGYGVCAFTGPGNVSNSLILGAGQGQLILGTASSMKFGNVDAASPTAITFSVQNVVAGTSNTAGVNTTIAASQGTGTGAGGDLIWNVSPAGSSGTAQNASAQALRLTQAKSLLCGGTSALSTTATDGFIYINSGAGTPTGTPTTQNSQVPLYFDTTNSQLWVYAGGAWKQPKTPAGAALVTWQ